MAEKTEIILRAKDETKQAFDSVKRGLDGIGKSAVGLTPLFSGLTAALSVGAFAATINNTIKFAAALDDMAEATGASVENLSALSAQAKISGTDMEGVETALVRLAKALHSTDEETKGAGKALEAIGLSIEDLAKLDTAEAMFQIAKALDGFSDSSGKAAVIAAIFGKNVKEIAPYLKDLAEQTQLVSKVTAEQAAMAEQYDKNINRLTASFSQAGKTAAFELLPFLTKVTDEMVRARDESGSLASTLGGAFRTAFETVAVLAVNTAYVIKQVGIEIGGLAAQAAAVARLDFSGAVRIGDMMKEDAAAARKEVDALSDRILDRTKQTSKAVDGEKKSLAGFIAAAEKPAKAARAGDQAAGLIERLNEQIAVKRIDLELDGEATSAEKQRAKVLEELSSGHLKATAAQRQSIAARLDELVTLEDQIKAAEAFNRGLKKAEDTERSRRDAMDAAVVSTQKEAETYGMTADALTAMSVARIEDARALAAQNGALPEHLAYLDTEIGKLRELSQAQEQVRLKSLLSGTEVAQTKRTESDKALLESNRDKMSPAEFEQAMKLIEERGKKTTDELGEFAKQAAKNMQDAMAEFFIDPTSKGIKSFGETFATTLQKMIAQAGSAQLLKLMLGDVDKTGDIGGWLGSILKAFSGGGAAKSSGSSSGIGDLIGTVVGWFAGSSLFANGGIMTSAGPIPLNRYAGGGIARTPQLAMFGEGSTPEAYVPLPDGRRIPVAMSGGGGGNPIIINVNSQTGDPAEIRRSAASGARTALGVMGGARRYG